MIPPISLLCAFATLARYGTFIQGLREQLLLDRKKKRAKTFLQEMVTSRKLNQDLAERVMELQHSRRDAPSPASSEKEGESGLRTVQEGDLEHGVGHSEAHSSEAHAGAPENKLVSANPAEDLSDFLPDEIIFEMLKRERLLTEAKVYGMAFEQEDADKRLRLVKAQLRQAEPEFERLKQELEDLKNNPRSLQVGPHTHAHTHIDRADAYTLRPLSLSLFPSPRVIFGE